MSSITGLCDAFEINKKRPSTAIANPELSLTPGTEKIAEERRKKRLDDLGRENMHLQTEVKELQAKCATMAGTREEILLDRDNWAKRAYEAEGANESTEKANAVLQELLSQNMPGGGTRGNGPNKSVKANTPKPAIPTWRKEEKTSLDKGFCPVCRDESCDHHFKRCPEFATRMAQQGFRQFFA